MYDAASGRNYMLLEPICGRCADTDITHSSIRSLAASLIGDGPVSMCPVSVQIAKTDPSIVGAGCATAI